MKWLASIVLAAALPSMLMAEEPLPLARDILDRVVANLPKEHLDLSGRIIARKRRGTVIQNLRFQMALRWGETPARATYTLMDETGLKLEQLVQVHDGTQTTLSYSSGNPLAPASLPNLQESVRGTDFSWSDLTLSFLWWTPLAPVKKDTFRGRDCYVIEVVAPAVDSSTQAPVYTHVRLWIEMKANMMIQAEALDAQGKEIRSLWVSSIKQIGDTWMIKDLEVKEPDSVHRTSVIVDQVLKDGQELRAP